MKSYPLVLCFIVSSLAVAQVKITTTSPLPNGTVEVPYTATITTSDGSVPFVWSAENMPVGLTLTPSANTRSATLSGTPTTAATYNFSISAKAHGGHTSTIEYSLTVESPPAEPTVELSWKAGGANIVGYNVYRSTTSGGPYSQINDSLVDTTTYLDTAVVAGRTYYYVTIAVNKQGEQSGYSNQAEAQVPGN